MRVYLVFQGGPFDDCRLVKVFSTRITAEEFQKGKIHFWIEERDVE